MSPSSVKGVAGPLHPLLTGGREYPFVTLEKKRQKLAPPGLPTINFGMGDPREETPAFIREALRAAVPETSSYPAAAGQPALRVACAGWLQRRFGWRKHDRKPEANEIAFHLVIWSVLFEGIGPLLFRHVTGDRWDVAAYVVGGLIAWIYWNGWGTPEEAKLYRS